MVKFKFQVFLILPTSELGTMLSEPYCNDPLEGPNTSWNIYLAITNVITEQLLRKTLEQLFHYCNFSWRIKYLPNWCTLMNHSAVCTALVIYCRPLHPRKYPLQMLYPRIWLVIKITEDGAGELGSIHIHPGIFINRLQQSKTYKGLRAIEYFKNWIHFQRYCLQEHCLRYKRAKFW